MKKTAVFGSTGSIGTQTLSVAGFHPDEFEVYAIAANKTQSRWFAAQMSFTRSSSACMTKPPHAKFPNAAPGITVVSGGEVNSLAALSEVDIVVNGVSGFAGLFPLLSALRAGKTVGACKQRKHCLRTRCCEPRSR